MAGNENHMDNMLFSYNVSHFHLGIEPDEKYPNMVKGGKFVVYAIVTDTHFYAIDILDHSLLNNIDKITEMLNGVEKDWPDLIDYRNILSKLNSNETNDNPRVLKIAKRKDFFSEIKLLPAIKLNSGGFFSGLNTTMGGNSVLAVRNNLIIKSNIQIIQSCFERMINDDVDYYKENENGEINAILTLDDEGELIITSQELDGLIFRTGKNITDIISYIQG
ncbi:hypothetical protein KSI87_18000 [Dickeya zeae]|nr:hypothetical protein [Dickeya zeae]